MTHLANLLIYGGLTAAAALSVGFYADYRAGWLTLCGGAVVTGILLAVGGNRR